MKSNLESELLRVWPTAKWEGLTVLVGVSGGPDSVALADCLRRHLPSNSRLVLAHLNHALRGQESDADQQFVSEFAKRLDCAFVTSKLEIAEVKGTAGPVGKAGSDSHDKLTIDTEMGGNAWLLENARRGDDEESLRRLRYRFYEEIAGMCGARYVALGHTLDDSVETTFYNFVRGTGLRGLVGIPAFRELGPDVVIARPLIRTTRAQVMDYLIRHSVPYRIDSSNQLTDRYARNVIRHEVLPMIQRQVAPGVQLAVQRASEHVRDILEWVDRSAEPVMHQCEAISTNNEVCVALKLAEQTPWPVMHAAIRTMWDRRGWPLQSMGYEHWQRLRALLLDEHSSANTTDSDARGERASRSEIAACWAEQESERHRRNPVARSSSAVTFPSGIQATRSESWLRMRRSPSQ
jgi:tRNA(Ile)-lysidine synthase